MPEEVKVTNLTSHTITVEWKQPETGPKPEEYHVTYINLMTNTTVQVRQCCSLLMYPTMAGL